MEETIEEDLRGCARPEGPAAGVVLLAPRGEFRALFPARHGAVLQYGTVPCDGSAAYRSFGNGRGDVIILAGCWAQVRRKFYEALEQTPRTAGWIVRQLQHFYRVEAESNHAHQ